MRYRRGERVIARRDFQGMNRPLVPVGAEGEIVTTTAITGRPKTVRFHLMTEWGPKTFTTWVARGDVGRVDAAEPSANAEHRRGDAEQQVEAVVHAEDQ
jgi:hypothetical protein